LDNNFYACKCFDRNEINEMLQIDGKLIYKNVFVKKEIEVASMI